MVFITVALAANGFAETGKMGTEQESERGKKLYVIYCQSCHGQNGIGQAPIPWSIRNSEYFVPPALDDSQHAWHHSDEDLIKMILEGSPRTKQMPSWKKLLSKQDAADLVAYMKSLWGPRALECQGPKHMSCLRE
jgi:mono/diheme cytochrome c family protein